MKRLSSLERLLDMCGFFQVQLRSAIFFRDTREGSFLQELLGTYEGVLVSDFFTASNSVNCPQQKCLIHLMRDINDDLRKDPYDQEMRSIAEPFGRLLKEIVLTIDRYGLRRRHLHKYAEVGKQVMLRNC